MSLSTCVADDKESPSYLTLHVSPEAEHMHMGDLEGPPWKAKAEIHWTVAWSLGVLLCPHTDPTAEDGNLTGLQCLS